MGKCLSEYDTFKNVHWEFVESSRLGFFSRGVMESVEEPQAVASFVILSKPSLCCYQ